MVQDTGTSKGIGGVRPLGLPRPIQVRTDQRGWPVAVKLGCRRVPVTVEDRWRVDDEWWRDRLISRLYYNVVRDDGEKMIVYQDLMRDMLWYSQHAESEG